MAENETTNDFWMTTIPQETFPKEKALPNNKNNSQSSSEVWRDFTDNTTLHGIRYVFMRRHILVRLIWILLLLASGGYYVFVVYNAFSKYYGRPINTVISTTYLNQMDFPSVTICSLNLFAKSKLLMTDDSPLFASNGLNLTSCAVTSGVRGNQPCGLSILCCCTPPEYSQITSRLPNCTSKYRQELLDAMEQSSHHPNFDSFYRYYAQDINSLIGPICTFGWEEKPCSSNDFSPMVTPWGMCYTFNSGTDGKTKTVDSGGVSSGLSVILDAQTYEYFQGKFSEGFKVLIHGQGEYVDEWEGINVGPGQHAVVALSQKRYKNLEKPYATNCSKKTLKTFSSYTLEGCLHECEAENVVELCGCRPVGYKGAPGIHTCVTAEQSNCESRESDHKSCECEVPCSQTKYSTEVSYSKFPDPGTAEILDGYYGDIRDNLALLQVGFKSLSYEIQEQQPAYDSNSLFGEIGGNMGLFLGCSLLTICEFFDFLISFLATRRHQATHPFGVTRHSKRAFSNSCC